MATAEDEEDSVDLEIVKVNLEIKISEDKSETEASPNTEVHPVRQDSTLEKSLSRIAISVAKIMSKDIAQLMGKPAATARRRVTLPLFANRLLVSKEASNSNTEEDQIR